MDEDDYCLVCARGFYEECISDCKRDELPVAEEETTSVAELYVESKQINKKGSTREGLKDPQSTGRKRAARLYPIDPEAPCEWQGKKNCGGGKRPIVGCLDGKQRDRHHGPVKNVTRNHEGNVHRICKTCHNNWHELNDLIYDELDYGLLPHDPVAATEEEIALNRVAWITGEMGKKYELASTKNMQKNKMKLDN